ncbi:unnamed protein product, partial [Trichogramma brassicae]
QRRPGGSRGARPSGWFDLRVRNSCAGGRTKSRIRKLCDGLHFGFFIESSEKKARIGYAYRSQMLESVLYEILALANYSSTTCRLYGASFATEHFHLKINEHPVSLSPSWEHFKLKLVRTLVKSACPRSSSMPAFTGIAPRTKRLKNNAKGGKNSFNPRMESPMSRWTASCIQTYNPAHISLYSWSKCRCGAKLVPARCSTRNFFPLG